MQKFPTNFTEQTQRRARRPGRLLLLLSFLGLLLSAVYTRSDLPALSYQLVWVLVASAIIGLVSFRPRGL